MIEQLPLLYKTPSDWAAIALSDPVSLLNDHAHLEKKAASNALEMLCRWPHGSVPDYWSRHLSNIAKEESDHLYLVVREIYKRGGDLSRHHKNPYAGFLHKYIRTGKGQLELTDRLLVAGLIEARSCERFELLSKNTEHPDLAKFYESLMASEAGHFSVFFELAEKCYDGDFKHEADRWLSIEAEAIQSRPPAPLMHSGYGEVV